MRINDPDIYFGKKIKVIATDGQEITGELYGYDYDYDDEGNEVLEVDIENDQGLLIGMIDAEIKNIEVIDR